MKKIALLIAFLMMLTLMVSCSDAQTSSTAPESAPVSDAGNASREESEEESEEDSVPEYSQAEPTPVLLYVNAIDGKENKSIAGLYHNTPANPFTEGSGAFITAAYTAALPGFGWSGVAIFAPTEEEGVYECIYSGGSTGTPIASADLVIPEGGFLYAANTGNDWPALVAANADLIAKIDAGETTESLWWYPANKDYPNFMTPQITDSHAAASSILIGAKATIVGIDIENGTIADDFGAYISVINQVD